MNKYQCDICGEEHSVFKTIKVPTPGKLLEIPEAELRGRVKEIQNSYIIDDKVFLLKGDIFLYKEKEEAPFFNWSIWTSIMLEDFKAKAEELQKGNNVEFDGRIETQLPFYEQSKGLKVKTIVNINYDYAVIKVEDNSPLKRDQTANLSEERIVEIMQMFYHPRTSLS